MVETIVIMYLESFLISFFVLVFILILISPGGLEKVDHGEAWGALSQAVCLSL